MALQEAGDLPQHAAMVRLHGQAPAFPAVQGDSDMRVRARAFKAIDETRFVPKAGQNRLRGMIEDRPDWVLSRQRAWGVPIAVFVNDKGEVLKDEAVNKRIFDAFMEEGADAWFADGAAERFLGSITQPMNGRRCATFSMCGSIQARPMPSAWNSAKTSSGRWRQTSISKAPTSIAAGSTPRCWKAAARVAAHPMTPC
jgi:hypothetical protein